MDRDYKYNWDEMIRWFFISMNIRINNTGWMMKWRWNGGVERKAKLLGECWTFFNQHFPAPVLEAMSRICACKTEKNLQIFGWCLQFKQSNPWATLSYFCLQKQGRKINAMRQVVLENVLKRAQYYHSRGMRRSLFANWIYLYMSRVKWYDNTYTFQSY